MHSPSRFFENFWSENRIFSWKDCRRKYGWILQTPFFRQVEIRVVIFLEWLCWRRMWFAGAWLAKDSTRVMVCAELFAGTWLRDDLRGIRMSHGSNISQNHNGAKPISTKKSLGILPDLCASTSQSSKSLKNPKGFCPIIALSQAKPNNSERTPIGFRNPLRQSNKAMHQPHSQV